MCVNDLRKPAFPQVNYGQGSQAWNPSDRSAMYQAVERARKDARFAYDFAADILFAKSDAYYGKTTARSGAHGEAGNGYTKKTTYGMKSGDRFTRENTLNPAKSWVSQAFGSPVLRYGDEWYAAVPTMTGGRPGSKQNYGFKRGSKISDPQAIRMLSEGHYAFTVTEGIESMFAAEKGAGAARPGGTAKASGGTFAAAFAKQPGKKGPAFGPAAIRGGSNGGSADRRQPGALYVPWAAGFTPAKGFQGKPEAGNAKKEGAGGGAARDAVIAETARPGNVLAGAKPLLGNDEKNRKALLGR